MKIETFLSLTKLVILIAMATVIFVLVNGMHTKWSAAKEEIVQRDVEKTRIVQKVKDECDVVRKKINRNNADVTYKCPDGVEYTIMEWF